MVVVANLPQDKPPHDQYTNTFTPKNVVPSTIYLPVPSTQVLVARDSTFNPGLPITIGSVLGGFALLLLLAALAYFLWRVRQGKVHLERIGLVHLAPRERRGPSIPPFNVIEVRMERRVSTETYSPETALPWSLLRNYQPTAPTAPAPATLPLPNISRTSFEAPTVPERARVIDPQLLQDPHRSVVPSFNLNARSNDNTPIPHTPPPAWRSLSPRPPTYNSSAEDGLTSSGH